jgi:hypothetical protein
MTLGKRGTQFTIPLLIILLGTWLRFHALAQDRRFHPDEALFSTFARAAAINGDWMLPGALDKTPLAIYANALSQAFIGDSEFAARLPGVFASILLIPVMGALACVSPSIEMPGYRKSNPLKGFKANHKRLFSGLDLSLVEGFEPSAEAATALFAMLITALSPFAIAFSATAFTDGMMLLFMTLALWLVAAGRWGWSGFALALGFACKQQALFYLPLVLVVGIVRAHGCGPLQKCIARFILAFGFGVIAILIWDAVRGETSIFMLAAVNNDPWRLIRANEILPRLITWLSEAQRLTGESWLTAILIVIALVIVAVRVVQQPRHRAVLIDMILLIFILAYMLLHWVVAFNTYDRYLLPIMPPLILLIARGIEAVILVINRKIAQIRHWDTARCATTHHLALILLFAILLTPAIAASEGRTTINDEYRQYEGIDELAAYLNSKPVATVIYDRWLGWELAYYMGQWTDKRRVYYPTPDELVRGALALHETGPRYLPAPAQQPMTPWLEALREAGFKVARIDDTSKFVVYEIIPVGGVSSVESSSPGLLVWCGDEFP